MARIIEDTTVNSTRKVIARTEGVEIRTPEGGEQSIVLKRCVRTFIGDELVKEERVDYTFSAADMFTKVPEYIHLGVDIRDALDLYCSRTARN